MRRLFTALFFSTAFLATFSFAHAANVNLQGYAWSDVPQNNGVDEGAGWIKFSGPGYAVFMDDTTGVLTGYAWANGGAGSTGEGGYGWLSFAAADVAGCPTAPCTPTVNLSTGVVTGWAKFLAAPSSGVWNGWVHLNPNTGGVTYSTATGVFSGYAWGDSDIGWVKFCGAWTPNCVATAGLATPIGVSVTPGAIASQVNWRIDPGAITGTGNGNITVFPPGGIPYCITVTSANPSGYNNPNITVDVNSTNYASNCTPPLAGGETVTFHIDYAVAFNYSMATSPNSITIESGLSDFVGIVKTLLTGSSQAVNIFVDSVDGGSVPGWFNYSLSNDGCAPTCTTTIQLSPQGGTGVHTVSIKGTSAGIADKFTSFQLTVTPALVISCNITTNPASGIKVYDTMSWNATISGGSGTYPTITWGFNPAPTSTPVITTSGNTTSASIPNGYGDAGLKTVTLHVEDSASRKTNPDCSASITVKPKPVFIEE